jgi:predicted metal-dependent phosphoesterase TrpH
LQGIKRPLLCELHAHTTWSDGQLSLRELVDLYGRNGFDVVCVTDHAVRSDDPWLLARRAAGAHGFVDDETHSAYLEAIEVEGERARVTYGLLLVPGLEITQNAADPDAAAHALAIGLSQYVSADLPLEAALARARMLGAALVAAHLHADEVDAIPGRTTRRFWNEREGFVDLVDRFELFNRHDVFGWVAEARLPAVASGDFHGREHLATWKTLLPCEKHVEAVVDYLRSGRPAFLAPLGTSSAERLRAA